MKKKEKTFFISTLNYSLTFKLCMLELNIYSLIISQIKLHRMIDIYLLIKPKNFRLKRILKDINCLIFIEFSKNFMNFF